MRRLVSTIVAASMLVLAGSAQASPTSVFGGAVKCRTLSDGVRFCGSLVVNGQPTPARTLARSWDGTAVDVNFALPKTSAGHRGPFPLVMLFHGYGGHKLGLDSGGGGVGSVISSMAPWLAAGYATFSMSDRGFSESCGTAASRASVPASACAHGFNHLLDTRYEVRDAQFFAGELVDEGLVSPTRIGAIGGSYGGGMSMALAALKNRVMLPDGRLIPWRSPRGEKMSLAAATPLVPWTDLSYALVPNGSTLDYVADAPYRGRFGVMKESYVTALYAVGCGTSTTFCTTTDPNWNLSAWLQRLNQGEPYVGPVPAEMLHQITRYHSSYYIDHSEPPAPLLIANGWTDDLFPADEALRYYNRTKTQYPKAPVSLFFGDWGHPRAQNKQADVTRYVAAVTSWLAYYVKGVGRKPFQGVQALTETCPGIRELRGSVSRLGLGASVARRGPLGKRSCPDDPAKRRRPGNRLGVQPDHCVGLRYGIRRDPTGNSDLPAGGAAQLHDGRRRHRDRQVRASRSELAGRRAAARRGAERAGDAGQPSAVATAGLNPPGAPGLPTPPGSVVVRAWPHREAGTASQRRAIWPPLQRSARGDGLGPPVALAHGRPTRRCRRARQAAVAEGGAAGLPARIRVRLAVTITIT